MRHRAITSTLVVGAVFGALSTAAAFADSPWWDGPVLDVIPDRPTALQTPPPEVETMDETQVAAVSLDLDLPPPPTPEATGAGAANGSGDPADGSGDATDGSGEIAQVVAVHDPRLVALRQRMTELATQLGAPTQTIERPCLVEDAHGCQRRQLDRFYSRLADVALGEATEPVRYSQFGDSLIMGDGFCGELRRLMQNQFGDGGHGFVYMGHPERTVGAEDITVSYSDQWSVRTVVHHTASDPLFGFAGAAFTPNGSPTISLRFTESGIGSSVDRVGLLFFPRAASFELGVREDDDWRAQTLDVTSGSSTLEWIDLADGTDRVIVSGFDSRAIWFGAIAENTGPGVVVDNVGLVSGRMNQLDDIGEEHWRDQVRLRGTDVLSFIYGVNAAEDTSAAAYQGRIPRYTEEYAEILERVRRSMPERDCLVMSMLTRGRRSGGGIETIDSVPLLVDAQADAAQQQNCAFWNTYEAIGGDDAASDWNAARPQLLGSDLTHPTNAGYDELARRFYVALIHGFVEYLDERLARPADAPTPDWDALEAASAP